MSYLLKAKTIFCMEVKKFFQSKKSLISTFLAGPILTLLIFGLAIQISKTPESKIEIYSSYSIDSSVTMLYENIEFMEVLDGYEESVSSGKNIVAILIEEKSICIYYDSSTLANLDVLHDARKIATNIMVSNNNNDEYPIFEKEVSNIHKVSINGADEDLIKLTITITSLIFLISLMNVNSTLGGITADSVCGEMERGTYDALRLSGTETISIIIGKFSFVFLLGFLTLLVNGAAIALGLSNFAGPISNFLKEHLFDRPLWFMPFVPLFAGISFLETSLFFVIAVFFDKVKHAMSYVSIVQILLSLSSYISNIFGENSLGYMPISNTLIIFEYMLKQENYVKYVVGSSCIALIASLILLAVAIGVLNLKETKK